MTNPKPTEGWAVVSAAGNVLLAGTRGSPELIDDETIIPVTIIPTADLVKEAARVLVKWLDEPMTEGGMTAQEIGFMKATGGIGEAAYDALEAALRALAGQGGE